MIKTIYTYHPDTSIFVEATEANPSPLEPGVFLIPAHATDQPPPVVKEGQEAIFDKNTKQWTIRTIPQPTPSDVKADMWNKIKTERDQRMFQGEYSVANYKFANDPKNRCQHLQLAQLAKTLPKDLQWPALDGTFITMTEQLVTRIVAATVVYDQALYTAAEKIKAAMEASPDPGSYDISIGWPECAEMWIET